MLSDVDIRAYADILSALSEPLYRPDAEPVMPEENRSHHLLGEGSAPGSDA